MPMEALTCMDPVPSFPTCPRLRTAPSQTLFEQLSMKVALSLARTRSTRRTGSDWNWDPFLIYDLTHWICSFHSFLISDRKNKFNINRIVAEGWRIYCYFLVLDLMMTMRWILLLSWYIEIILEASQCNECVMSYIMIQLHEKYNYCLLAPQFHSRDFIYHDFVNDITLRRRPTCGAMQHLDPWRNSWKWKSGVAGFTQNSLKA